MLWGRGFGADSIPFGAVKAVVKTAAGRRVTENCWMFSPYMALLRAAVRARRACSTARILCQICDFVISEELCRSRDHEGRVRRLGKVRMKGPSRNTLTSSVCVCVCVCM